MLNSSDFRIFLLLFMLPLCLTPGVRAAGDASDILPGAWQTEEYIPLLKDLAVGVVVNQASEISGVKLADTLLNRGKDIRKIFTPEHGFKGTADAGAHVEDGFYSGERIPVISLYGNRRKPLPSDLEGIDIMLFDLQDVGVRFFTYISTLHYIMEACAESDIPLIILDRPNPNGHYVDGPLLESGCQSFVGMHPVPVVYGMTIGEYAQMINGEYWLADSVQCNLVVIRCRNYTHKSRYRLPVWPSPNLTSMRAIYLYPSTAFFEGTVASEGRGTSAPFQLIGHPEYPRKQVSFVPTAIPGASLNPKFKGMTCYGIDLRNIPVEELSGLTALDLSYLLRFYDVMDIQEAFFTEYFDLLAGNRRLKEHILQGMSEQQIRSFWNKDLEAFKTIRIKYLLYPDFN